MWPSVKDVLFNVYEDGDDSGFARTLTMRMESYDFVFILHLMKQILAYTNDLSNLLQKRDQNIVQAMHLIKNVKTQLLELRDRRWETFLLEVESFCVTHSINVVNMDDIVPTRTRMKRDGNVVTYFQHYRYEVYHEVLDKIGLELHDRFPELTTDLLLSVACLDPRDSFPNFNGDKLVHLAEIYSEDFSWAEVLMIKNQLEMYIYDVKRDINFAAVEDLGCLSKKMVSTGKAQTFPLVYRLIELALLLPVATASVEKVFSAMNIVKTDLRNRMSDDWLNDCLVVFSSKDIFINIDNEDILDRFQAMTNRRCQLPPRNRRST
ncbi:uncharacterized protein [Euphorbia lathyris]|uniref:uncharacterized protein n=1 Tax=Euphorbia lathyris TaxID=212925 RepID=UPI00331329F7